MPFGSIAVDDVGFVGTGLSRPECVLCTQRGDLFVSDFNGGVTSITGAGQSTLIGSSADLRSPLKPNGIALEPSGSFLVAHLGDDEGGVFRLHRNGAVSPILREVDGIELPPTNFVLIDEGERVWITVSTRRRPRHLSYQPGVDDGFIVLMEQGTARIVADGLAFANELRVDAKRGCLWAVETYGRRLLRFSLDRDGALTHREIVTEFGYGTYPDGIALDADGAIWVVSIVSNRVIRVDDYGAQEIVLEDCDEQLVADVERAYLTGTLQAELLGRESRTRLKNISSIAFGGLQMRTAFLGCISGDQIAFFQSLVNGRPPVHWRYA